MDFKKGWSIISTPVRVRWCFGHIFTLIVALLGAMPSHADISVFASDTSYTQFVVSELQKKYNHVSLNPDKIHENDVVVSIGDNRIKNVTSLIKNPQNYIAANVSSRVVSSLPGGNGTIFVYSDPSPEEVIRFLASNFKHSGAGFLYSESDDTYYRALAKYAEEYQLPFHAVQTDDVFKGIVKVSKKNIGVFLISKNTTLYTSNNLRFALESLYRKRIPVVATNSRLIQAGVLATISIRKEQYVNQILLDVATKLSGTQNSSRSNYIPGASIQINSKMESFYGFRLTNPGEEEDDSL